MRVALAAFVVLLLAASAAAGPYPLDVTAAAQRAYGAKFSTAVRTCEVYLTDRDLEGLVEVRLTDGHRDVAAFQFVETAGWDVYWRLGKPTGDLARYAPSKIRRLRAACGRPWR